MLTDADITRIVSVVATKEDIKRIDERLESLEETMNKLAAAGDATAGAIQDLRQENALGSAQLSRHDEWIKQIAEETKIKLAA